MVRARARRAGSRRSRRTRRRGSTAARPPAPGPATFFSSANGCVSRAAWERVPVPRRALRGGPAARARHAARRLREGLPAGRRRDPLARLRAARAASGACSTSSARCARSTASARRWRRAPVARADPPRGRARPRVGRAGAGWRTPRCPRCAITPCARSARGSARAPTACPPAVRRRLLARAARDLRAHPPVTSLLRFRLVRHLRRLFGDLPRRAVLTWRYHGPREALRRALLVPAAADAARAAARARRRGCRTRRAGARAGTARHGAPGRDRDPDLRPAGPRRPRRSRSIRATTRRGARAHHRRATTAARPSTSRALERIRGVELVARRARSAGFAANANRGLRARARPTRTSSCSTPTSIAHRGWLERLQYGAYREPDVGDRRAEAALPRRHDPVRGHDPQPGARRSGSTTRTASSRPTTRRPTCRSRAWR